MCGILAHFGNNFSKIDFISSIEKMNHRDTDALFTKDDIKKNKINMYYHVDITTKFALYLKKITKK